MSKKVNVNIRLEKEIKEKAKKLAFEMWTTLSTVLNMYLYKFVETKKLEYIWWDIEVEPFSEKDIEEIEKLPNFKSLISTFSWR